MTAENMRHWDALKKTNPEHTKDFQRAGGFRGTAIKPVYAYEKMTAHFGPCGVGWGMGEPSFQLVEAAGETLVYCTVAVWHGDSDRKVYGVGGDKVTAKRKDGSIVTDDEAFKKAYTDALTNALVKLGVSADVHMGMFEDSKYVRELEREFAEENAPPAQQNGHAKGADDATQRAREAYIVLDRAIKAAQNLQQLEALMEANKQRLSSIRATSPEGASKLETLCLTRKRQMEEPVLMP